MKNIFRSVDTPDYVLYGLQLPGRFIHFYSRRKNRDGNVVFDPLSLKHLLARDKDPFDERSH